MIRQTTDILTGDIIENETSMTLQQLCDACSVDTDFVIELVNEGCIEPGSIEQASWYFNGVCITRVRKAKRLQRDLGLNLAGVVLAIELIDEIERLRKMIP